MTAVEKFTNNAIMLMVYRAAIILTPILLGWIMTADAEWRKNVTARFIAIEAKQIEQHDQLTDLNFRAMAGKQARETLTVETKQQFASLSEKVDALKDAVTRIQTTIENRLPMRTGEAGTPQ